MCHILCGWHFCKDGLMHNTIPNIFSNMKSVLILLLSICCTSQHYTQSSLIPSVFCILIPAVIFLLVMIMRRHKYDFKLRELKLRQEIDEQYISGLEHSNQHMAKELHDGVCNHFTYIGFAGVL